MNNTANLRVMKPKHKIIKIISVVAGIILIGVILIILLISPIAKYIIEKNDITLTNRHFTLGSVYVNPFTGYVRISNLKIYEYHSDSIFISAGKLRAHFAMLKLLSKTVEISDLTLDKFWGVVDKNGKVFNFNDVIRKFTPPKKAGAKPPTVHFNILNVKINDGIIYYREKLVPINYFIKNAAIEWTGKRCNSDSLDVKYSFLSGPRPGSMSGIFSMNVKSLNYRIEVIAHQLDLKILEPYIRDSKKYGTYSANLETNLKAKGNFRDARDVTFTGMLAINKFHFGKNPTVDFGSFEKLQLSIYQLNPKDHKYLFDSASITRPFFKLERYDHSDNLTEMFGKKGSRGSGGNSNSGNFNLITTIGNYIAVLSKNFFRSDYKINRVAIYNGDFRYNDYSLSEKFGVEIHPVNVLSDSIDKTKERVNIYFSSNIKPSGTVKVTLNISPKDSGNFDLNYILQRIPATLFNPYLIYYTSYPLNRGIIEMKGHWMVRNGIIKSTNHLEFIDPRLDKRVQNNGTKRLPMPLIMAIIRDKGNVIDYQIPITGRLRSPTFHLYDVIRDALVNIIVKPVTTPYRLHVKSVETDIEKSLTLKWEMNQRNPDAGQEKFIAKMADFLKKNPEASIQVQPRIYFQKEKEFIQLFEAKKKFYLALHHQKESEFGTTEAEAVEKMSIKDTLFMSYLNKHTRHKLIYTVQDKCALLIPSASINKKLTLLNKDRATEFLQIFKQKGVEKQVTFTKAENSIPFNGYSFYKITYRGDLPKALITAYRQMNNLNNEPPRKEYKADRKKNKSLN